MMDTLRVSTVCAPRQLSYTLKFYILNNFFFAVWIKEGEEIFETLNIGIILVMAIEHELSKSWTLLYKKIYSQNILSHKKPFLL